jgi:hypothetical protein
MQPGGAADLFGAASTLFSMNTQPFVTVVPPGKGRGSSPREAVRLQREMVPIRQALPSPGVCR